MKNLITFLLIIIVLSLAACGGDPARQRAPQESSAEANQAQAAPAEVEEEAVAPAGDPAIGQEKFTATCAACHGPEGQGVPGLGKDMTVSEFIADKSDAELVEFIKVGRDPSDPLNTTGVAMPVKGGNPALSDEDLQHIVSYIRTLQK